MMISAGNVVLGTAPACSVRILHTVSRKASDSQNRGRKGLTLRVLICDERPLISDGLRTIIDAQSDMHVVGEAESGIQALALVRSQDPDVVLTGPRLRGMSGIDLVARLGRAKKDTTHPGIVYAMADEDASETDLVRAGADGLLADDASRDELILAIRAVANGQAMLGSSVARRLLEWIRTAEKVDESRIPLIGTLTAREREIFLLTARGHTAEDIARELYIGLPTVRTHIYRVRCKLHARDRAQLVSLAYQTGLVQQSYAW
jgi:DNA-binding NarL/FixJ family response regulator